MRTDSSRAAWVARLVAGLSIIGILFWWQGSALTRAVTLVSWQAIVGAVLFYWLLQFLCAWKWQLLLNAAARAEDSAHQPLSLRDCVRFYLAGMFWNLWMPSSIGGDAVRAYLAGKKSGSLPLAASAVLADRLSGLLALLLIGAVAIVTERFNGIGQEGAALSQSQSMLWMAALLLLAAGMVWMALRLFLHRFTTSNKRLLRALARRAELLYGNVRVFLVPALRRTLVQAFAISLVFQSGVILLNIGLGLAVQLPLEFFVYWWLVPALSLASLIPVGIGGLGVREAAAVALAGSLAVASGAEVSTLIVWSLLWQVTLWLAGLPGAWCTR